MGYISARRMACGGDISYDSCSGNVVVRRDERHLASQDGWGGMNKMWRRMNDGGGISNFAYPGTSEGEMSNDSHRRRVTSWIQNIIRWTGGSGINGLVVSGGPAIIARL